MKKKWRLTFLEIICLWFFVVQSGHKGHLSRFCKLTLPLLLLIGSVVWAPDSVDGRPTSIRKVTQKILKHRYRQRYIHVWKHCSHPNLFLRQGNKLTQGQVWVYTHVPMLTHLDVILSSLIRVSYFVPIHFSSKWKL